MLLSAIDASGNKYELSSKKKLSKTLLCPYCKQIVTIGKQQRIRFFYHKYFFPTCPFSQQDLACLLVKKKLNTKGFKLDYMCEKYQWVWDAYEPTKDIYITFNSSSNRLSCEHLLNTLKEQSIMVITINNMIDIKYVHRYKKIYFLSAFLLNKKILFKRFFLNKKYNEFILLDVAISHIYSINLIENCLPKNIRPPFYIKGDEIDTFLIG